MTTLAEQRIAAQDAAIGRTLMAFRMATVETETARGTHLFRVTSGLSECRNIYKPGSRVPVEFEYVDCLPCLEAFTEATRPRG
jgi:hypothetical protein